MNRRSFVAALAAVVVSGKGRSFSPHKPRGRELVDADTPTRPSGLVRLKYDRLHPPGREFYIDPKALRRLQLSGMDEEMLRTFSEEDAAAHVRRVMAR